MKVCIIYRSDSDHARQVEEYIHDFKKAQSSRELEVMDVNTKDGAAMAELYDVLQYPAVLALSNDGQLMKAWTGDFPLMNELAYYTQEG